jgi:hypothetical protein
MTDNRAPFEALDAYQAGVMPDTEAAVFEEELFAAAAGGTASEAELVDRLSLIGRYLWPRGGWDFGSSRARVDELIAAGHRVQVLVPQPGPPGQPLVVPRIDDDAELVATHVAIDVRGYESVDVVVEKPDGTLLKTFRDIGFDPTDGSVYALCEAPLARISAQQTHICSRVIGTRNGTQHLIASFEVVNTP